jgi:lipopolysaccharide biosynthesis regulator YciM
MSQPLDSDLRLGQIAIRMGVIAPQDLPALLHEARAGHAEESAGGASSLAQILLRKKLLSVSDYMYMAKHARQEIQTGQGPAVSEMETALKSYESGELDASSFEELIGVSGEPLSRPTGVTQKFDRYELISEVARGGMGIVYRARTPDGTIVALKVMIEADDDEVRLQRFEREAELAAALTHPGIVRIYDAGRVEGIPYFTMDLVIGDSLDDLLEGEGIERNLAIKVLAQVARASDHAHQRGIIHRDLKPGNILIERKTHNARITDFGLARDLSRGTRLTQVGQAVGTPYYMAPEQVRGERDVDGRCDLYAIGVILYEILTGDVPFDADSPLSLFKKIDREEVYLPLDPENGIDENIHKIVMRALEKDREERYSRGNLLAEDLERYLEGLAPKAQPYAWREGLQRRLLSNPWTLAAIALAAVALGVLGVLGTVASRRMRDSQLATEGSVAATKALDAAQTAETEAQAAISDGDPKAATDPIQRGAEALKRLQALLEGGGPRALGAQATYDHDGGDALRVKLLLVRAEMLVLLAEHDPKLEDEARKVLGEAKTRAPRDLRLRRTAALFFESVGDAAGTLEELAVALDLEPTDESSLFHRSRIRLLRGDPEAAAADLSRILLRSPNNVTALVARSQAFIQLGRLQAARTDAKNACSLAPDDPEPAVAYGDVAWAEADTAAAFSRYRRAMSIAPDNPLPYTRAGELNLSAGSFEGALDSFEQSTRRNGGWRAAYGTASAHAGLFNLNAAVDAIAVAQGAAALERKANRATATAQTYCLLGQIRLAAGDSAGALKSLQAAVSANEHAVMPRVWLSRLLLDDGVSPASKLLEPLSEDREDPDLLAARSRIALANDDAELATSLAERAVAAAGDKRHARARRALALARLRRGADDAARAACDAAWIDASRGPELASEFLRRARELQALGTNYKSSSLQAKAKEMLRAVVLLDPHRAPAWVATAALQNGLGEFVHARTALERAAKDDPFNVELAELSVELALQEGSTAAFRAGVERVRRAIEFQGVSSRLLLLLARCHVQLEEWQEAIKALDRAARIGKGRADVHLLRETVLAALGRKDDAKLAARRAEGLGADRDRRRRKLFDEARAIRSADPRRALDLANEALSLTDSAQKDDWPQLARFVAGLLAAPEERLEALAPVLAAPGLNRLDEADAVLSKVWLRPLPAANQRRLRTSTRRGGPAAALAAALAGVYDGLTGQGDPASLRTALASAEQAVALTPASIAAHFARAYLRVHTGDPARGLRELRILTMAESRSSLVQFALAESLAALGQDPVAALSKAKSLGGPGLAARIRNSSFLR